MAVSLLAHVVISDLCLGKPALRSLPISATIADTLAALRNSEDNFISIWDCADHHAAHSVSVNVGSDHRSCTCTCVGKVCMVDVICYLCKDDCLLSPSTALKAPVSAILPKIPGLVMHLEPSSRYYLLTLVTNFGSFVYFMFLMLTKFLIFFSSFFFDLFQCKDSSGFSLNFGFNVPIGVFL